MELSEELPDVKYKEFFKKSEDFENNKIKITEELYKKELYSGILELCFIASKHAIQAYLAIKGKGFTSKIRSLIYLAKEYIDEEVKNAFEELCRMYIEFE